VKNIRVWRPAHMLENHNVVVRHSE